jgi:hypothetical protein
MKKILMIVLLAIIGLNGNVKAQWIQTNGPYGGQDITCLVTNGTDLFAGTYNGMFISSDNGDSWTPVNNGLKNYYVRSLAVSGNNIFAGTYGGVYLSTDKGNSWNAMNTGMPSSYDTIAYSLAVKDSIIFAGIEGSTSDGVYLSTNNGDSWTPVNNGFPTTNQGLPQIMSLGISGSNIFAGTGNGIFVSSNNGGLWTEVSSFDITGENTFAAQDSNIYFASGSKIYLSSNNGTSWTTADNGLMNNDIMSLAVSGNIILAGADNEGVFMSTNNGGLWTNVSTNGIANQNVTSFAIIGTTIFAGTDAGVWKRSLSDFSCSAQFSLVPDTTTLHHYFVVNNATGVAPLTYLWSWGDGTYDSIAYPTHTYSAAGNYTICLTIHDAVGCTSTYCDSSYLQKTSNSIITVDVVSQIFTGINEKGLFNQIMVYPNPASEEIQVIGNQCSVNSIEIFNLLGEKIYCTPITDKRSPITINIAAFAKGLYFLKVENENGYAVKKFEKE